MEIMEIPKKKSIGSGIIYGFPHLLPCQNSSFSAIGEGDRPPLLTSFHQTHLHFSSPHSPFFVLHGHAPRSLLIISSLLFGLSFEVFPSQSSPPFHQLSQKLIVEAYTPPDPGAYPQDQPKQNSVRFTPTQMEGTFAEELYSASLQSTKSKLGDMSLSDYRQNRPSGSGVDDSCEDDGSLWGGSDEGLEETSVLDREWQRRHDQFHTIGYRDGLIAGKEAAAQDGFNVGFKQSVSVGYKLGLVRGVSSVLASLHDDLKEKLMGIEENRSKFQILYESVNSLSTADALRLFNDDITAQGTKEECVDANTTSQTTDLLKQNSDYGRLEKFYGELEALLPKSPALNVHLHEEEYCNLASMQLL